ncbi:MAG: YggS family pyridoxal phosphate-dependent enzyme [Bacteroidales bacterium]|nr:YggS family pyridoxal phosphate-dependent enzyme [Bacteroidales bacterium]
MIKENLQSIKEQLPSGVTLVAVSKFHPSDAIAQAYNAGQRVFAESRPQELASKVAALGAAVRGIAAADSCSTLEDLQWHFIGHLQTNKLKMVLPYVSLVHSVDSLHLLTEINKWGKSNSLVTDVLLELHVAQEDTKQGFAEEEVLDLLFRISDGLRSDGTSAAFPFVRVKGLMAMATNTEDMDVVRADFERVQAFKDYVVDLFPELGLDVLSTGMSSDWPVAVECGSNMVRIGTAIFGERNY